METETRNVVDILLRKCPELLQLMETTGDLESLDTLSAIYHMPDVAVLHDLIDNLEEKEEEEPIDHSDTIRQLHQL